MAGDHGIENISALPEVVVYKSPTCGCCVSWANYLEEEGFTVSTIDREDVESMKPTLGIPDPALYSCHTAVVDGYVIEGHVPAMDIKRLLDDRPSGIAGLSAPGMPTNSPGMASREPKGYSVLSFTEQGDTTVYSQY